MGKTTSLWLIALLLVADLCCGQASFSAVSDASKIVEGNYFEVFFTIENGRGSSFEPPEFENFEVLSGPNTTLENSIINGRSSIKQSYSYILKPKGIGKWRIGAASVSINGKRMVSAPLFIEVVKGTKADQGKDDIFVRAELNAEEGFIGQQLILDYCLYTASRIEFNNYIEENEYPGFYSQEIRRYDSRTTQEVISGRQYSRKVLKRIVLFPQQTGQLVIPPSDVQLKIVINGRSLFSMGKYRSLNLETDSVPVVILELPPGAPESFSGGVGQYQVSASLNRTTLTTDDALKVKMVISGNGDIKRVRPPSLNLPEEFEVYDPSIINEGSFERKGGIVGQKEIEFLTVPTTPGNFVFRPAFSYYDPDSAKYVTLRMDRYDLEIRPGSNRGAATIMPETEEGDESERKELRPIKTRLSLVHRDQQFLGSPLFWILLALPFAGLLGVWGYRQLMVQRSQIDPALVRHKRARKAALKRLDAANQLMQKQESRNFYNEISKAMLGYVSDKLKIPRSELTKENVRDKLSALNVKDKGISAFMKIIQTTEMAIFAGKDNAESMNETYEDAIDVLAKIDSDIKE